MGRPFPRRSSPHDWRSRCWTPRGHAALRSEGSTLFSWSVDFVAIIHVEFAVVRAAAVVQGLVVIAAVGDAVSPAWPGIARRSRPRVDRAARDLRGRPRPRGAVFAGTPRWASLTRLITRSGSGLMIDPPTWSSRRRDGWSGKRSSLYSIGSSHGLLRLMRLVSGWTLGTA